MTCSRLDLLVLWYASRIFMDYRLGQHLTVNLIDEDISILNQKLDALASTKGINMKMLLFMYFRCWDYLKNEAYLE